MKKQKLNIKRIIISLIIFFIALLFLINHICSNTLSNIGTTISDLTYSTKFKTIKQDTNDNYLGIGQKTIENMDGYFTTFTTVENNKKTYIEYKQNGNSSWSNKPYWDSDMAESGCGITAIAIILSGYNRKFTPENLRQKYYPVLSAEKISTELNKTFGIKNTDFYFDSVHLSKKELEKHLKTNRPILICVWNKPCENRWTTASHYMVLLATDGKGMVYVSNPNGLENNSKSSGWYNFDEVTPYIAKALYIEDYK